jgi:nucleoside-diphosphate-sugar epimerase
MQSTVLILGARGRVGLAAARAFADAGWRDLARTFVAVAQRRATLNPFEVLHFAGSTISRRQWLRALTPVAQEQGWVQAEGAVKVRHLPWALLRLGSWVVATWGALAEMAYLWERPHSLDNAKLRKLIDKEPHTPLEAAARQALVDLGLIQPETTAQNPLTPHNAVTT